MTTLDARFAAAANGSWHFRPRRILEADERSQHEILFGVRENVARTEAPDRRTQHTKPAIRHRRLRLCRTHARLGGQRLLSSVDLDPARSRQELFGRAFDEEHDLTGTAMHRHESLALGLERNLVDALEHARAGRRAPAIRTSASSIGSPIHS